MLELERVTVRHGSRTVLRDVNLQLEDGDWLMVAGPNGAGKSTLIQAIAQGVAYEGAIRYRGHDLRAMRAAARSRRIGVLSQKHQVSYPFTVEEVVALGRFAHRRGMLFPRDEGGARMVCDALEMTGLADLRDHSVLTLSGGELQRTFLAQVFAQDPELIVLDEPTSYLDLKYQKRTFELIQTWLQTPGRAALSVVHDLSLARTFGTRAMLLHQGVVVACGCNRAVLNRQNLMAVYGMDVQGWMTTLLSQWAEG